MIIAILGLMLGILLGFIIPFEFSTIYALYISVGILAAIDSIVGAIKASILDEFDAVVFVSGFIVNALLAIFLSYIGDKLGVPMYYAAMFVFGTRLFTNMGAIRNIAIQNYRNKRQKN